MTLLRNLCRRQSALVFDQASIELDLPLGQLRCSDDNPKGGGPAFSELGLSDQAGGARSVHFYAMVADVFPAVPGLSDFPKQRAVALDRKWEVFTRYGIKKHRDYAALCCLGNLRRYFARPRLSITGRPITVGSHLQLRCHSRFVHGFYPFIQPCGSPRRHRSRGAVILRTNSLSLDESAGATLTANVIANASPMSGEAWPRSFSASFFSS